MRFFLLVLPLLFGFEISAKSKERIAILDFADNAKNSNEALTTTDVIRSMLFNTDAFEILERKQMEALLEEQGFQQSDLVSQSDSSNLELGRMLGVNLLVSGSMGKIKNVQVISARIIDVKTGKITSDVSKKYSGDSRVLLEKVLPDLLRELTGIANIKSTRTIDDKINIPMWSCVGLGTAAAGYGIFQYFLGESLMNDYRERGRSDYTALRDKVKNADLLTVVSFSVSGAMLIGAGGFWLYNRPNQKLNAVIAPGALQVAWKF